MYQVSCEFSLGSIEHVVGSEFVKTEGPVDSIRCMCRVQLRCPLVKRRSLREQDIGSLLGYAPCNSHLKRQSVILQLYTKLLQPLKTTGTQDYWFIDLK